VVTKILRAARWAPSSRNLQPWHFIVVRDRVTLIKIGTTAASGRFIADAPLAIAIVIDRAIADSPELDAGRALQQMELVAWSEGLGTCFVGIPVAEQNGKVKDLLGIPAEFDLITVMPFGYRPDAVPAKGKKRRPLSEIAHAERFGAGYPPV
jgi:nitroreductase